MQNSSKIKRIRLIIYGFFAAAIMTFIFVMSAMPAQESSNLSGSITSFVIKVLYPDYTVLPAEEMAKIYSFTEYLIRKCAHFSEYAALGVFLAMFFRELLFRRYSFAAFITAVLYALSDEWHQSFINGRGSAVTDVIIDSAGALFGIALTMTLLFIRKALFKKQSHRISE